MKIGMAFKYECLHNTSFLLPPSSTLMVSKSI
jgi:hypothetical protein